MHTPSTSKGAVPPNSDPPPVVLALRAADAAAALGISERALWTLTNQGLFPHVRLGKAIVYPVTVIEEWLREQALRGIKP